MNKRAQFPAMMLLSGVVVLIDHFTKFWFLHHFQLGESRPVTSFFCLTLVQNTGTAFGLFQDSNRALLIVSYLILGVVLYGARGLYERGGAWSYLGVALIVGGAIGNIVDRHLYGHVIDFLDFHVWPVFNIADSAITVGTVLTAIGLTFHKVKA
jgi:signal peptidase II